MNWRLLPLSLSFIFFCYLAPVFASSHFNKEEINFASNITADTLICLGQSATIEYTGPAGPSAIFTWEFSGGTVLSGTGAGPYEVTWDEPGIKKVSVIVDQNGDVTTSSIEITVAPATPAPDIECYTDDIQNGARICLSSSNTSLNTYEIKGISGTRGYQLGNCFFITGLLSPADGAMIEVLTMGEPPCGDRLDTFTCQVRVCPTVSVNIHPVSTICLAPGTPDLQLSAQLAGATGPGTLIWNGPGVSPDGLFSPETAGVGNHEIIATYKEDNCTWSGSITISVVAAPVIAYVYHRPPLFVGQTRGDIDLVMDSNGPYSFQWFNQFGQLLTTSEDLHGPPGNYFVSITNQHGCVHTEAFTIAPSIFRVRTVHVICLGESVQLSVRPGNGADFEWSPATGLSCTDCSDPIASPSVTTTYRVTATLPDGRSGSTNVYVIVLPPPFCPTFFDDGTNAWKQKAINELKKLDEFSNLNNQELAKKFDFRINKNQYTSVKAYPNPFEDNLSIFAQEDGDLEVLNMNGEVISRHEIRIGENVINLENLSRGTYFIKIKTENTTSVDKVIKL